MTEGASVALFNDDDAAAETSKLEKLRPQFLPSASGRFVRRAEVKFSDIFLWRLGALAFLR